MGFNRMIPESIEDHKVNKELFRKLKGYYGYGRIVLGENHIDNKIFNAHVVRFIWQGTPTGTYGIEEIEARLKEILESIKTIKNDKGNMSILRFVDHMLLEAIPEPDNTEITIKTVCGEFRTISMNQEITSIEYMGKKLTKDSDGFLEAELEGLGALFG